MERGSDKHSPRVDEQLEHEVEGMMRSGRATHAQEWADPEPPGDDQPEVDRAPGTELTGGVPEGMTPEEVTLRSEIAAALERSVFPAGRDRLLENAVERYAPPRVLEELQRLPADRSFGNIGEVWTALGHGREDHRF
ncbi:MAG TPA: DUF2795 domain-containing protein [Mycobacteriales bacterium]|jgi:hypothetical protein|nr:DUF2795 domain-containing protein [Mycobacteriales bacterium]